MAGTLTEQRAGSLKQSARRRSFARLLNQKAIMIGGVVLILMAITALAAPLLSTHDPNTIVGIDRLKSPSGSHFLARMARAGTSTAECSTARVFLSESDSRSRPLPSSVEL